MIPRMYLTRCGNLEFKLKVNDHWLWLDDIKEIRRVQSIYLIIE